MQNIEHPLHHRIQKSLLSIVGVFRYSCYVKEHWTRNQISSPILTVYRFVILSKPFNLSEASFSSRVCVCVYILTHVHTCTSQCFTKQLCHLMFALRLFPSLLLVWSIYWTSTNQVSAICFPTVPLILCSLYCYHTYVSKKPNWGMLLPYLKNLC